MKKELPKTCPACSSEHLSYLGAGTQKAEAALSELSAGLRVLRMDADTTGVRSAYERILSRFRERDADVLLGTQMVTKGHDFPAVALSGVLLADTSLYMNDFRASERTFALLTQVIGRAGRADTGGRAIIQTFSPNHKVIRLAAEQDYPAFYEDEIALRRAMKYPPFCDMAEVFLTSSDERALLAGAKEARDALIQLFKGLGDSVPVEIYGPLEPQTYKVAEKFRMKLLLKCRLNAALRRAFAAFLRDFLDTHPKLTVTVDFNPSDT
jgi:primosomal protein N' (replication factor Y)